MKSTNQIKIDLARAAAIANLNKYYTTLAVMQKLPVDDIAPFLFDDDPNIRKAAKILIEKEKES